MAEGIDINTIQNQLNYLKETKAQIQQSLINKGQVIDDTVSFRDYSKGIDKLGSVKQFDSIEDMQADTGNDDGAVAVVYKSEVSDISGWDATVSGGLCLIKTIEADGHPADTVQNSGVGYIPSNSGPFEEAKFTFINDTDTSLNVTGCVMCYKDASSNHWGRLKFTYKGKDYIYSMTPKFITTGTYTTIYEAEFDMPDDELIYLIGSDVGTYTITYTTNTVGAIRTPSAVIKLMKQAIFQFGGLFTYRKEKQKWLDAQTQLSATADLAMTSTFFGANGIETGVLDAQKQITDETKGDILNYCNKYDALYKTINTTQITDFSGFNKYISDKTYGIDFIKVTSNATNMASMFSGKLNLCVIDMTDWNTSNVTNMAELFRSTKIQSFNAKQFSFINVTNTVNMFSNCKLLSSLANTESSYFNNTQNTYGMFEGCDKLTGIDVSNLGRSMSNSVNCANMFSECRTMSTPAMYQLFMGNSLNCARMFYNCQNMWTLRSGGIAITLSMANCLDSSYMFYNCLKFQALPSSTSNLYSVKNACSMFRECQILYTVGNGIGTNRLTFNSIEDASYMFFNCHNLNSCNIGGNGSNLTNIASMYQNCFILNNIPNIFGYYMPNLSNGACAFCNCKNLKITGITNWNLPSLSNVYKMYDDCVALTNIQMPNAYLPMLTSFIGFNNCNAVQNINLYYANIPNVKTLTMTFPNLTYAQFYGLKMDSLENLSITNTKLTTLNFSVATMPNLKSLANFAYGSTLLTSVNISGTGAQGVNMGNITSLYRAFAQCANLTTLNCSGWDTSNVTTTAQMFNGCSKLNNLSLSNWTINSLTNATEMFRGCYSLTNLDLSNWEAPNLVSATGMFRDMGGDSSGMLINPNLFSSVNNITLTFAGSPGLNWNAVSQMDMSNVKTATQAFGWLASGGEDLSITNINLWNATNAIQMFQAVHSINTLDLSNWNISSVNNLSNLFCETYDINCINVTGWNTSNLTNISNLFRGSSIPRINGQTFVGMNTWDLSKVTSYPYVFYRSGTIQEINIPNLTFNNIAGRDYVGFAYDCTQLRHVNLDNWTLPNITQHYNFFTVCKWQNAEISMRNWNVPNLTTLSKLLHNCWGWINKIDLDGWYAPNVKQYYGGVMFYYGDYAQYRHTSLANWYAPNLTSLFFTNAQYLIEANLTNMTIGDVNSLSGMFNKCYNLSTIDFTGTHFPNVTNITDMFSYCNKLTNNSIDNIINVLLNMSSLPAEAKVLNNATSGSPFFRTNINSAKYSARITELQEAGWTI